MTPYLCLVFQLWQNQGFLQSCIAYLSMLTIVPLIVPKFELAYFLLHSFALRTL